jgi:hypothetical protein
MEAESARREIKGLSFNKEEKEAYMWLLRKQAEDNKEEKEAYMWLLRKQAEEQARKEDEEMKKREELAAEEMKKREERAARERREERCFEVRNGQLVEYNRQDGPGRDNIFKYLFRLITGW